MLPCSSCCMTCQRFCSFLDGCSAKKSNSQSDINNNYHSFSFTITHIFKPCAYSQNMPGPPIITQLAPSLLLYLTDDHYSLRIVKGNQTKTRINSEHRIIFVGQIEHGEKGGSKVVVVDKKMQWVVYEIKEDTDEAVKEWTRGQIVSEDEESTANVVSVQLLQHKIFFILDGFQVMYAPLPYDRPPSPHLLCRPFLPYCPAPNYQHHPFSYRLGFLPLSQQLTHTLLILRSNQKHLMLLAFYGKQTGMSSVQGVEMYDGDFRSSRHVLLNIEGRIRGVYDMKKGRVIVQSQRSVIKWDLRKDGGSETQQTEFKQALRKDGNKLIGITTKNEVCSVFIHESGKIYKETIQTPNLPQESKALQLISSSPSYLLSSTHSLYRLISPPLLLIRNLQTPLASTQLHSSPYHNFLIAQKQRAQETETIAYGNHLFAVDAEHLQHGLMLRGTRMISSQMGGNGVENLMTSPMVGAIKVKVGVGKANKKDKKGITMPQIDINLVQSNLKREETLAVKDNIQITPDFVYSTTNSNTKAITIDQFFQGCADSINSAAIVGDSIALAVMDQIHIFDTKTLKRKYIYCCNDEIKHLYGLNDVNLLGVECWNMEEKTGEDVNQLLVLVLGPQKAEKKSLIAIPEQSTHLQLRTTINTAQYCLNLFNSKVVACSNDPLHRYQSEKIVVMPYELQMPSQQPPVSQIVPLAVTHSPTATDCLLINRHPSLEPNSHFDQATVFLLSLAPKYLQKDLSLDHVTYHLQQIALISSVPRDRPLQALLHQHNQGTGKNAVKMYELVLLGEKNASLWKLRQGRVEAGWLQNSQHFLREVNKLNCVPEEVRSQASTITLDPITRILPTHDPNQYLFFTARQLFHVGSTPHALSKLGYYSLLNDAFLSFRNNLSPSQVNDSEYLALFNQKLVIRDAKYLSHSRILLLYTNSIVVLQIIHNQGVVVRQQIKFNQQEGVVQIQEFLQNHSHNSIYLRQKNGRIYIMKEDPNTQMYSLIFDSYTEEDVSLFARVSLWHQAHRTHTLAQSKEDEHKRVEPEMEEIIVKKDGQLIIKGGANSHQSQQKMVYL